MSNFCIGIISYFPDEVEVRNYRQKLCFDLINKCQEVFAGVPIIVVAQNWQGRKIEGATLYEYDQLGIYQARNELKKIFLASEYDNLIMLDDDAVLKGDEIDGRLYLKEASNNPNKIGYFYGKFLKLCCMPKEAYKNIPDFTEEHFNDEKSVYAYARKNGMYTFKYPYTINRWALLNRSAPSTWATRTDRRLAFLD